MTRPGPITSRCGPPEGPDAPFEVEIRALATGELIDRARVRLSADETAAFAQEVARCRALRIRDHADWEPIVVRLVCADQELDRKEIS